MNPLTALPCALLALLPQQPEETIAHFQLAGKPAVITRTDVALEMGFHLRRRDEGQQAVEVLVDTLLIRRAATKRNLMPTDAEVRGFWLDLQRQLRAAGRRPEEFAAVRNTGEAQWLRDLAVQMAQERLVRDELGMKSGETVSGDMLKLWQQEERKKARIVTDPDALPVGTAARVDGEDIPLLELGLLLLRTSEDDERFEVVQRVAYLQSIEALARQHGVDPTPADLQHAIDARRAEAARDPRYRGLSFEQLLKSQGFTVEALRELRVFRAQVLLQQLAARLHPNQQLLAELQQDRQKVLDLVGPRRRIGMIFVRALDEPNALVPMDWIAATKHLEGVRDRVQKERWDTVARIESQEPASKAQGGDTGWHTRRSEQLPELVLATAWQLATGEVSQPVRGADGVYLVKVLDLEPDVTDDQLVERLRALRADELKRQLLREAKVEFVAKAAAPGVR